MALVVFLQLYIMRNKMCKITKIFNKMDYLKGQGVTY